MKIIVVLLMMCISLNSMAEEVCLVKWSKEENKDKFLKGKDLSVKEKMREDLMISRAEEKLVVYYLLDKTHDLRHVIRGDEINDDKIEDVFRVLDFRSSEYKRRLKEQLSLTGFKHSLKDAKIKLKGYRKVNCKKYRDGTYL